MRSLPRWTSGVRAIFWRILPGVKIVCAVLSFVAVLVVLTGCTASGAGTPSKHSCNAECRSEIIEACAGSCAPNPSDPPAMQSAVASALPDGGGNPITDNYDTALCVDWNVTPKSDRLVAAIYYATKYDDPQPDSDASTLVSLITKTCKSYGAQETPSDIARVSINTVYHSS